MPAWTRFGWQGFDVSVPSDWELVGLPKSHDPAEGHVRLDDRLGPRLEIKWRAHPQKKFDIEKTLDNYITGIKKQYEKEIGPIDVRRDQAIIPDLPEYADFLRNKEIRFFSWRAGIRAHGVVWRCLECRRTVMAQTVSPSEEKGHRSTSLRVLGSLRDHATQDANLWTAYGLSMEVPRRYRLNNLKLLNGYIMFSFSDGSGDLAVERYGLADQQLRSESLESWYRRAYRKSLRGTYFVLEAESGATDAIRLTGRSRRVVDVVDRWDLGASRAWDLAFRRPQFRARAWCEPDANRINVVRASGKAGVQDLVERVAASMKSMRPSEEAGVSE